MNNVAGMDAPKKDNAFARLDRELGCTRGLAEEIASITNAIRDGLIGPAPPLATAEEKIPGDARGLFGIATRRQSETNKILTYILEELRTVANEIS